MKLLLDECVPARLRRGLKSHECVAVTERPDLRGLSNGALLDAAEAEGLEVLVTVDSNLQYQQSLKGRRIAVVLLTARSNSLKDLLPHCPAVLKALENIRSGATIRIE
jgi:predicted nuclease of predicted toxin-antitoxin system